MKFLDKFFKKEKKIEHKVVEKNGKTYDAVLTTEERRFLNLFRSRKTWTTYQLRNLRFNKPLDIAEHLKEKEFSFEISKNGNEYNITYGGNNVRRSSSKN